MNNRFFVGVQADRIRVMAGVPNLMTFDEALNLAANIIAIVDVENKISKIVSEMRGDTQTSTTKNSPGMTVREFRSQLNELFQQYGGVTDASRIIVRVDTSDQYAQQHMDRAIESIERGPGQLILHV